VKYTALFIFFFLSISCGKIGCKSKNEVQLKTAIDTFSSNSTIKKDTVLLDTIFTTTYSKHSLTITSTLEDNLYNTIKLILIDEKKIDTLIYTNINAFEGITNVKNINENGISCCFVFFNSSINMNSEVMISYNHAPNGFSKIKFENSDCFETGLCQINQLLANEIVVSCPARNPTKRLNNETIYYKKINDTSFVMYNTIIKE